MIFPVAAGILVVATALLLLAGLARGPAGESRFPIQATRFGAALLVPGLALSIYLAIGRPDLAGLSPEGAFPSVAALQSLVAETPEDPEAWRALASALDRDGWYDAAAEAWRQATLLPGGDDADTLVHVAEALILASDGTVPPEALPFVNRALEQDPGHVPARFFVGLADLQAGRFDRAIERWTAMVEEASLDAEYRPMLEQAIEEARAQGGLPEVAEAPGPDDARIRAMVDGLAARLVDQPDDIEGWKRLGRSRRVLGELEAAAEAYAQAVARAPRDPDALEGEAEARLMLGGQAPPDDRVIALFRRLLDLDPDHALALFVLGEDAAVRGHTDDARAYFLRLLERLPDPDPARDAVTRRLAELGE